jgi:enoyl-CoA hydratase/carnithine racemase
VPLQGNSVNRSDAVLLERIEPQIALVTLNRPEARNAVNGAVVSRMREIIGEIENDPDLWVAILTGSGRQAFCAGADLKEISAGRIDAVRSAEAGFAGFVFSSRTKPWIGAINGPALAGGLELVLACELSIAAEHAVFGLPEVRRSLVAGAGGLWRLPRSIPRAIANRMILTGMSIDAATALSLGLVNDVVPENELMVRTLQLAREVCDAAPLAVREAMAVARAASLYGEPEFRVSAVEAMLRIRQTADFAEGPKAFVEKRPAKWQAK